MGLDMYLEARLYISPHLEATAALSKAVAEALGYCLKDERPNADSGVFEVNGVSISIGYWRKCYLMHNWFVNNVQEGHDDCRPAFVSESALETLAEKLDRVNDNPASTGEMFVSEDNEVFDPDDVMYSIRTVQYARQLQRRGWDIYYQSSW